MRNGRPEEKRLWQKNKYRMFWREEGRTYYATGEMYDNTYQEHDLTETEKEALESYLSRNGIELDERFPIMTRKEVVESGATIEEKQNGTSFLDALQKEQIKQDQSLVPVPEMSIGIGT